MSKLKDTQSLATGATLTQDTFNDFIKRLQHHCVGDGVADHCTADAVFLVQAKRITTGIDPEYTDSLLVHEFDDQSWTKPSEFYNDSSEEMQSKLDEIAQSWGDANFLSGEHQWEILKECSEVCVTGFQESWETVNFHFTLEAANAFMARKKHDYPDGLRVYVDAQSYCWEFNTIKEAILTGKLVFKD